MNLRPKLTDSQYDLTPYTGRMRYATGRDAGVSLRPTCMLLLSTCVALSSNSLILLHAVLNESFYPLHSVGHQNMAFRLCSAWRSDLLNNQARIPQTDKG